MKKRFAAIQKDKRVYVKICVFHLLALPGRLCFWSSWLVCLSLCPCDYLRSNERMKQSIQNGGNPDHDLNIGSEIRPVSHGLVVKY